MNAVSSHSKREINIAHLELVWFMNLRLVLLRETLSLAMASAIGIYSVGWESMLI